MKTILTLIIFSGLFLGNKPHVFQDKQIEVNNYSDEDVSISETSLVALDEFMTKETQCLNMASRSNYTKVSELELQETGVIGTCKWQLYNSGELLIGDGELTLPNNITTSPFAAYKEHIKHISFRNNLQDSSTSQVTANGSLANLFADLNNVEKIDLRGMDTSQVTDMSRMFKNCTNLSRIELSSLDTGNVFSMEEMFFYCSSLIELDLSSFDTGKVMNMFALFMYCTNLNDVDLSNFNTSNVTDMGKMFESCTNLVELDLQNFDTKRVTEMDWMFSNCLKLERLNLSGFSTTSVRNMLGMFNNLTNLIKLSLGTDFRFSTSSMFGASPHSWRSQDGLSQVYTAMNFQTNFGSGDLLGGTYIAVKPYLPPELVGLVNQDNLRAMATLVQELPQQPANTSYIDLTFSINVTNHIDWGDIDFMEEIRVFTKNGDELMHADNEYISVAHNEEKPEIVKVTLHKELLILLGEINDEQVTIQLSLPIKNEREHILSVINLDTGYLHIPLQAKNNLNVAEVTAESLIGIPEPKGEGIAQVVVQGSATSDLYPKNIVKNLVGSFGFDEVFVTGFKEEVTFNIPGQIYITVEIETDLGITGNVEVPVTIIANPAAYIVLPAKITLERSVDNLIVGSTNSIHYIAPDDVNRPVKITTVPEVKLVNKYKSEIMVQVYNQDRQPLQSVESLAILSMENSVAEFHLKTSASNFFEVSQYQGVMTFNVEFVLE